MMNAIASEPARPTTAPSRAPWVEVEKMIARVKTTVSSPSRPTAWKARRARRVRARPELTGKPARVPAHPERHVGQHDGGQQVRGGLEDRLDPGAVVLAD